MNKRTFTLATLFVSLMAMFALASCSDDDDAANDQPAVPGEKLEVKSVTLPNPGYGKDNWIYFSLSEGKILEGINESNRKDNDTWDLAFYRYNVRTNSGLSGNGMGGALDTKKDVLEAVRTVPAGKFTIDEMSSVTSSMESFPPPSIETPLNALLGEAIKFQGPPPTYIPNNHVYIIRTHDGKYAKLQITSFANDKGEKGHLQFSYVYQPNGSKNF